MQLSLPTIISSDPATANVTAGATAPESSAGAFEALFTDTIAETKPLPVEDNPEAEKAASLLTASFWMSALPLPLPLPAASETGEAAKTEMEPMAPGDLWVDSCCPVGPGAGSAAAIVGAPGTQSFASIAESVPAPHPGRAVGPAPVASDEHPHTGRAVGPAAPVASDEHPHTGRAVGPAPVASDEHPHTGRAVGPAAPVASDERPHTGRAVGPAPVASDEHPHTGRAVGPAAPVASDEHPHTGRAVGPAAPVASDERPHTGRAVGPEPVAIDELQENPAGLMPQTKFRKNQVPSAGPLAESVAAQLAQALTLPASLETFELNPLAGRAVGPAVAGTGRLDVLPYDLAGRQVSVPPGTTDAPISLFATARQLRDVQPAMSSVPASTPSSGTDGELTLAPSPVAPVVPWPPGALMAYSLAGLRPVPQPASEAVEKRSASGAAELSSLEPVAALLSSWEQPLTPVRGVLPVVEFSRIDNALPGPEKNATLALGPVDFSEKKILPDKKEILSTAHKLVTGTVTAVGIGVAQVDVTMSTALSNRSKTALTELTAPGVSFPTGLSSPANFAAAAPVPIATVRETMVAVLAAVEQLARREDTSVKQADLKLQVGNEPLALRVELKDGTLQATFRTNSAELRRVLTQEWQAVMPPSVGRDLQVAPPVFSASAGSERETSFGSLHQGDPQHRGQPAPEPTALPLRRNLAVSEISASGPVASAAPDPHVLLNTFA